MDLQQNLIESSKQKGNRKRWTASAGSVVVHGILVAAIVVAGAQTKHSVAAEKRIDAFITRGAAPPPPPPPPPPPAKSSGASQPKVQSKPVVRITPQTLIAPREIPKEIPKIDNVPVTPMIETVETLPEVPSTGGVVDTGPGDATNGVPGGVEGGVAGGVVGGEVGGVVGGELGGVKGGELGGVVGGEVGGKGTGTEGSGTGGNEAPPEPPPPPPPPPTMPLRVGGDVKAPVVIDRSDPIYTETARKARIAGVVIVEAIISKSGRVEDVRVVKGLPMGLSEEAERAVQKWRFKPGTLNGQPVSTIFNLTVHFKLD